MLDDDDGGGEAGRQPAQHRCQRGRATGRRTDDDDLEQPGLPHLPEARSAPAHVHPTVVGAGSSQPSPRMSNDPNPTGHPQPLPQLLDELGR